MEEYSSPTNSRPVLADNSNSDKSQPATPPSPTAYLIAALQDPSLEVRRIAVVALGRVGDATAIGPLNELLRRDTDFEIRDTISQAISAIALRETPGSELLNQSAESSNLPSEVAASDFSWDEAGLRRAEQDFAKLAGGREGGQNKMAQGEAETQMSADREQELRTALEAKRKAESDRL